LIKIFLIDCCFLICVVVYLNLSAQHIRFQDYMQLAVSVQKVNGGFGYDQNMR
jgi:hypothetical protein